jgi:hypothetical protein
MQVIERLERFNLEEEYFKGILKFRKLNLEKFKKVVFT